MSDDPRWAELANVLVHHSTKVEPGNRVMIAAVEEDSLPLARALHRAVVLAGGYPQVQFLSESMRHDILASGNDEQLQWVPELEAHGMEWADVYIALRGASDLSMHDSISAHRLATNQAAQGIVSSMRWHHTRWCLVRVPNKHLAHQAGLGTDAVLDMFFAACLLDWTAEEQRWERLVSRLNGSTKVRIIGQNTDLSFSVEGRTWECFAGANNMPDGEIMTAPVTESINGTIWFENPGVLGGRLMHDLKLTWSNGELVEASASSNQDYLETVIATDPGARTLGEFGIGTNAGLTDFCNDILLDEKIYGTCHVALGRAYPDVGGTNQSAIHWDIVKDLRQYGGVLIDDQPILVNGKLLD